MPDKEMLRENVSLILKMHNESSIRIEHNASVQIPSASTIKVLIMACAMERFGEELDRRIAIRESNVVEYSLSTEMEQREYSLHDLILLMIDVSDNSAANELIDLLGMDAINHFAAQLGLDCTRISRKMMDLKAKAEGRDNVTCVRDLFNLMEAIRLGNLKGSGKMIEILSRNRDRSMLARFVDEDCFLAHKTGLNHDVVIDFGFDHEMTIAMAVFGKDIEVDGSELIGNAYRHYREGR